jgi:hypothetical protein
MSTVPDESNGHAATESAPPSPATDTPAPVIDLDEAVGALLSQHPIDAVICAIARSIDSWAEKNAHVSTLPDDARILRKAVGRMSCHSAKRIPNTPHNIDDAFRSRFGSSIEDLA